MLTWVVYRLLRNDISLIKGMRFGALAGIGFGVTVVLGNYSVFNMPPTALILWPMSSVLVSTVAGGIAAWVLIAEHPWRRVATVFGGSLVLIFLAIVIQNL
jgi:hypothetical protein